jgi:hypothetical protein
MAGLATPIRPDPQRRPTALPDRNIWRTIQAMLASNPGVGRGGLGESWLASCYANSQFIGIRRETDGDRHSTGMLRALNHLASNPRMATCSWYEQQIRHDFPGRSPTN